jgi:hypothetical protein
MPTLTFTAYQLIICTHRGIRTPIDGFGDRNATIAPYACNRGPGGTRTPKLRRGLIYSQVSQPIAQPIQI